MYIRTYFERETFHWTLWCCNLYLWVIMVSDVLLYVREARQWQKQGCSGEPFPRSINQVAVCSVSVVHQTTIWTKKDLESWFSVEGLDWCFCHVTKKQKVSIFPLVLLRYGILLPKLFWPTVRKNYFSDWEKTFEIWGWRLINLTIFEITRTIYSNSYRS